MQSGEGRTLLAELINDFKVLRSQAGILVKPVISSIAIALIVLAAPSFVSAESLWERLRGDPNDLPDRLKLQAGFAHIFSAETTLRLDDSNTGVGTTVDWADTLGGETHKNTPRVDAMFRFTPRHSVGFSWYRVDRDGFTTVGDRLDIGDITIGIGGQAVSSLDIELWRFFYNWSFYRSDEMEVAFSPGVGLVDFDFRTLSNFVVEVDGVPLSRSTTLTEREDLLAPLPSVGLMLNYHMFTSYFGKRLRLQVRGDFFWVRVKNYEGSLAEFYVAVEYRLFKYLGIGVGLTRQMIDVQKDTPSGWRVDNDWNQVYLYGAVYPF